MTNKKTKKTKNMQKEYSKGVVDSNGKEWASVRGLAKELGVGKSSIYKSFAEKGFYTNNGVTYKQKQKNGETVVHEDEAEYQEFLKAKEIKSLPVEKYNFKFERKNKR